MSLIAPTSKARSTIRNSEKLDIFGPTIEFIAPPEDVDDTCCIMRGTIAPGLFVPLHSHDDFETYVMISGEVEVLVEETNRTRWTAIAMGDVLHISAPRKHAFRNLSSRPAVMIITSTARMGEFFRKVGRPIITGAPGLQPPSSDMIRHFIKTAGQFGYWIGSAEENARIGLNL